MDVASSLDGRVGLLEINRPDRMNSLTVEAARGIGEMARQLVDQGARAVVIAGRGPTFCAGADLGVVGAALEGSPESVLTPLVDALHSSIRELRSIAVPLIAAVEGPAVGAGLGIALSADVRVLGEGARLVPGYSAIGSSPDGGVSYFLPRMIGSARAMKILLTNQTLDASAATSLGLADEVARDGTVVKTTQELAGRLASATAPYALIRLRELVDASTTQGLFAQLDLEQKLVSELWETDDFREGVTAFLERRSPGFTGS
jgi:2-(1,2-epoxy-1,2-dihydrophenyl)acetyl-CoA isomerase